MDSDNSDQSLQSSSDDGESSSTGHSSLFLPPSQPFSPSLFYGLPSSSSSSATYQILSNDILNQTNLLLPPSPAPPPPPPPLPSSSRNPRKRTRTSRRAPATILITDTFNFKAVVQIFTGVHVSPFSSITHRFDIFRSPSDPFPYNPFLPIPQNHQISTFQPLLPHQLHQSQTTLSSLHDLDSMNPVALQSNHPTSEDDHHQFMRRQFSELDLRQTKKRQEIHDNVASSSSSHLHY